MLLHMYDKLSKIRHNQTNQTLRYTSKIYDLTLFCLMEKRLPICLSISQHGKYFCRLPKNFILSLSKLLNTMDLARYLIHAVDKSLPKQISVMLGLFKKNYFLVESSKNTISKIMDSDTWRINWKIIKYPHPFFLLSSDPHICNT